MLLFSKILFQPNCLTHPTFYQSYNGQLMVLHTKCFCNGEFTKIPEQLLENVIQKCRESTSILRFPEAF